MNPRPSPSCRFQNSGSPGCRTEVCVPAGDQLRACCAPAGPRPAPSASPAVPLPPQQWPVTSLSCFKHLQLSCLQARKVSILRTHKMRFCLPGSLYDAVTLIPSAETPLSPNTALSQVPEKPGVGILGGHDATGPVIMDQKRNKQRINNPPPPRQTTLARALSASLSPSASWSPSLTLFPGPTFLLSLELRG